MQLTANNDPWVEVYASRQNNSPLTWVVTGVEAHGDTSCLVVMQDRVKGIIPQELSGINLIGDERMLQSRMRQLIGQPVNFIVTNIDKTNNLFTADRSKAIQKQSAHTWENIQEGQIRNATIRRIVRRRRENRLIDMGVAVEVDGLEAFIPVQEISHGWINNIEDKVQPGDVVSVQIQSINKESEKILVSLKALEEDPWVTCSDRYTRGAVYGGTVTGVAQYGIYIELEPGISVLCNHLKSGGVNKGDKVAIVITKLDPEKQKIHGAITRVVRRG